MDGSIALVGLVIVLVLVVIGGIWRYESQLAVSSMIPQQIPTTTNPQGNIYSNTVYGYSLKYPNAWSVVYQSTSADDIIFRNPNNPNATYFEIRYEVNANPSKELISKWATDISQHFPNPLPVPMVNTTVDGYPSAQVEGVDIGTTMITYVSRGSDIFEIDYELYDSSGATSTFLGDYQAMVNSITFSH